MSDMVMRTGMLIRRPVAEVFEAFVDPDITSRFWFTKGSGRLEAGQGVQWDWEMYGVSVPVSVKAVERNARILIEWTGPAGATQVEWLFEPRGDAATFVDVTHSGFRGSVEAVAKEVIDSTGGFSLLLAGAKAYLERGIALNLVADRFAEGVPPAPPSLADAAVEFLTMVATGKVREAYDRHVGPGFKHHNPYFRGDAVALREGMEANAVENPHKTLTVKQALQDGDRVATFSHVSQRPGDRGAAVVHLFRFEGGKVVELWDAGQPIPEEMVNENGMF
jgi:uncharacterized protein YndB with AHSA1/START domain/predicted SnoaL-like aldol condensation-catalyzing enzyme